MFNLDDVLYNAVSKPLFELLQKWFHWNRFRLISSCLLGGAIARVGISLVELARFGLGHGDDYLELITGLVFCVTATWHFRIYWAVKEDFKTCSDVFESGGYPKLTTRLIMYKAQAVRDASTAYFFVLFAFLWFVSLFTGGSALLTLFFVLWTFDLFDEHLWRSSDIDPKDRKTLLSHKEHPASASS